MPLEYPDEANGLAYHVLQKHMCCTCSYTLEATAALSEKKQHLANLLLRVVPSEDQEGNVLFNMLLSSDPFRNGWVPGRWQDVQLLVPP